MECCLNSSVDHSSLYARNTEKFHDFTDAVSLSNVSQGKHILSEGENSDY